MSSILDNSNSQSDSRSLHNMAVEEYGNCISRSQETTSVFLVKKNWENDDPWARCAFTVGLIHPTPSKMVSATAILGVTYCRVSMQLHFSRFSEASIIWWRVSSAEHIVSQRYTQCTSPVIRTLWILEVPDIWLCCSKETSKDRTQL